MYVNVLLFLLGLVLLIKGGDWFVDGATAIAHRFHVPELIIGATVVSIGTTLPEVMVSATSALQGSGGIAYGNAIGSIICNTSLIAAITAAVHPGSVDAKALRTPVLFFFLSAGIYVLNAYITGYFSRWIGILLLGIFFLYMFITIRQGFRQTQPAEKLPEQAAPTGSIGKDILLLVLGAALIAVGAKLLVDNGIVIAEALGVPQSVIGLTFVALGTSLPELVTAITSLVKGHGALSLGNVIGANIFNLVLVSGISIVLSPFPIPEGKTLLGCNASLVLDIPLMLAVMAILTLPALLRGRLSRAQGVTLLLIYSSFCVLQFAL